MRSIVKEVHDEPLTIQAELLLMYAARVQLVENRIKNQHWPKEPGSLVTVMIYRLRRIRRRTGMAPELIQQIKQAVLGDFAPRSDVIS